MRHPQRSTTTTIYPRKPPALLPRTSGGGEVVDKVVSLGSARRPLLGSNPTQYRFEAMPFVEWFSYIKDVLGW
ncbi:hypothetical protein E2C01_066330 [Portunus trituberculatus]|uniref:Uncharacterized protein n=1 Tax=Portunus trituberculatus TaxID=210409 RepID=A0A5B7HS16_PORTR|nr:hypothetical protein [Portunus trituberculatus]